MDDDDDVRDRVKRLRIADDDVRDAVRDRLRAERVKLWLAPYPRPGGHLVRCFFTRRG